MKHLTALFAVALASAVAAGCSSSKSAGSTPSSAPSGATVGTHFSLNDLSILFPAIAQSRDDEATVASQLLAPSTVGQKGPFLTDEMFQALDLATGRARTLDDSGTPSPDAKPMDDEFRKADLRAVAVRFDPCFPKVVDDDSKCQRQIRIVWQRPLAKNGISDFALHTLHQLTDDEFTLAMNTLAKLKADSGMNYDDQPLDVHPVMKKQGLAGPYATGLMDLIKTIAGKDNMVGIAFLDTPVRDEQWAFGTLQVQNGVVVGPRPVSVLGSESQLANITFEGALSGSSSPALGKGDSVSFFLNEPSPKDPGWKDGYESLLRIENPGIHTTETMDCLSCHFATGLRESADLRAQPADSPNRFSSSQNLSNPNSSKEDDLDFHNFGYFGRPSVSQRTINETALVVDWVNARGYGGVDSSLVSRDYQR